VRDSATRAAVASERRISVPSGGMTYMRSYRLVQLHSRPIGGSLSRGPAPGFRERFFTQVDMQTRVLFCPCGLGPVLAHPRPPRRYAALPARGAGYTELQPRALSPRPSTRPRPRYTNHGTKTIRVAPTNVVNTHILSSSVRRKSARNSQAPADRQRAPTHSRRSAHIC
jgi:hypothetical protein